MQQILKQHAEGKPVSIPEHHEAANQVILKQIQVTAIPKRFSIATKEIWEQQIRLQTRTKRGAETAFAHPRFRAAYDFLLLREDAGEALDGVGQWWTDFQTANEAQREEMLNALGKGSTTKRRRRRKPTKKPNTGTEDNA